MKNFQQQEYFPGTNKHFLTGGEGGGILPLLGGFPLLFSPSQLFAFSGWQFQKKHSVLENCKGYILQEVPVFALVLTHFRNHYRY